MVLTLEEIKKKRKDLFVAHLCKTCGKTLGKLMRKGKEEV